jgi:hypothetical protein
MKILLSSADVNVYLSRMLEQDGLSVEGDITWSWDEDEGPSAVVTLGAPRAAPSPVTNTLPQPAPKPRVEPVTVKFPTKDDTHEALNKLTEMSQELGLYDDLKPEPEMPKAKKKTRGPGKKIRTDAKVPPVDADGNNVLPRVRAYQEEVEKNSGFLRHPITGDIVNTGAIRKPSTTYPKS